MRRILGYLRKAVEDFQMIQEGDRIAVGVSGGKDSLLLLKALKLYQYFSPVPFHIEAITLTMGFEGFDTSPIEAFCKELGVPYTVKHTLIGKIIFETRKETNPCSLCARMRRGALHDVALELGCKKVALGHNLDDTIETFFLSLFYEGRFNTFSPVTYLDRKGITVIRPLIYAPEPEVIGAAKRHNLPIVQSPCPAAGHTQRQEMKKLVRSLAKTFPDIRMRFLTALKNKHNRNLWD
ncbi:tRNA 2-thiocytidine biosynthesis TtcA family protein [Caldicoprobacter guelmensis]|uniref:tRNA 2-thiocytidine biosynthesis TtcA family protein n=1 Tax=Caldicoprobacter guelmensis TaxID=1170224 RepID=UPI001959B150